MKKIKERAFGLDIIRVFAVFFVISVHNYTYQQYYDMPIDTCGKFILTFIRNLFYICVPLFLLLTGYLNDKAKPNKQYFVKIIKILISWFIIALICISYSIFVLHEDVYWLKRVISIFNFSADSYGWYVEMYVGLFLIIPFLNILYDNIKTKDKKTLIIILLFLTALPPLFSGTVFNGVTLNVIPAYWNACYPITYYFLGRYLKEKPLMISNFKKIILIFILLFLQSILMYFYFNNGTFNWGFMSGYGNLFTVLIAVLFFSIFVNLKCNIGFIKNIFGKISSVAFEIYLLSRVFDYVYYPLLFKLDVYSFKGFVFNYVKIVPLIFISSFICALIVNFVSKNLYIFIKNKILKLKKFKYVEKDCKS